MQQVPCMQQVPHLPPISDYSYAAGTSYVANTSYAPSTSYAANISYATSTLDGLFYSFPAVTSGLVMLMYGSKVIWHLMLFSVSKAALGPVQIEIDLST